MNEILEKELVIETPLSVFPTKIVSPKWSSGFECKSGSCGLCCISELPEGIPTKRFKPFNSRICSYYNVEKRKCNSYESRTLGCKTFPFIFGIEYGSMIISPSLECPSTNGDVFDLQSVKETFSDPQLARILMGLDLMNLEAISTRSWMYADDFWEKLVEHMNNLFERTSSFPFLYEAKSLVFDFLDNYFNVKAHRADYPPMNVILTNMLKNKAAIATNFQSNNPYYVRIHKNRAKISSYNLNSKKINEVTITLPKEPLQLEVDTKALEMVKDYVKLLMKRPFLSLSSFICLTLVPANVPSIAASNLVGGFVNLEAGATFTVLKNDVKSVNENMMREIISFSDGCLTGMFKDPSSSLQ